MKSNNMQLFKGFMFYTNEWDTFLTTLTTPDRWIRTLIVLGTLHPACGSLSYQMWQPTKSWHTARQTCTTQKGKL